MATISSRERRWATGRVSLKIGGAVRVSTGCGPDAGAMLVVRVTRVSTSEIFLPTTFRRTAISTLRPLLHHGAEEADLAGGRIDEVELVVADPLDGAPQAVAEAQGSGRSR